MHNKPLTSHFNRMTGIPLLFSKGILKPENIFKEKLSLLINVGFVKAVCLMLLTALLSVAAVN